MPKRKRSMHQKYASGDKHGQCKINCTGCHQRYASGDKKGQCKQDCTGCIKEKKKKKSKTDPVNNIGGRKGQIVVIDYAGTDYDAKIVADWGDDTYAIQYNDPLQKNGKKFSGSVTDVIQGLSIRWNVKSKLDIHPYNSQATVNTKKSARSNNSNTASSSLSSLSPVTNKNVQSTTFHATFDKLKHDFVNKLKGWTIDDSGSQRVYISPNGDQRCNTLTAVKYSIDALQEHDDECHVCAGGASKKKMLICWYVEKKLKV